jgi:hypothetical protein
MRGVEATFDDEHFGARVQALAERLGLTWEEVLELAFRSGLEAEEARLGRVVGLPGSRRASHG